MIYFVQKEEGSFNKGDKLKVFIKKYNPNTDDFENELLDDFVLENFSYDENLELFILISDLNLNNSILKEKLKDAELLIVKEK
jgi:hypothetical protein